MGRALVRAAIAIGLGALPAVAMATPEIVVAAGAPLHAIVTAYNGTATVNGKPIAFVGTMLLEGDRIETGPDGAVTFTFADRAAVTVPAGSRLVLEAARRADGSGALRRVFRLDRGAAVAVVTPHPGRPDMFAVRTQAATSVAHGTVFRVSLDATGAIATTTVLRGVVGVTDADQHHAEVAEGHGARADGRGVAALPLLDPPTFYPVYFRPDGSQAFTFAPVAGAARYHVQVARDDGFRDVLQDASAATPSLDLPALRAGLYFVRATAVDADGLEGLPATHFYVYRRPAA